MKYQNLEDLKGKEAFKVPDGYFEDFEARLLQQIDTVKPQPTIRKLKNLYVYAAAAVIVVALGIPFLVSKPTTINSISNEDLQQYLEYNTSYGVKSTILNELEEADYVDLEKDIQLNDKDVNDYVLSQIDIEYYLNTDE